MKTAWIKPEDKLPQPKQLVWVKRFTGNIYLGCREDKPLSIQEDKAKDCFWCGNPIDQLTVGYSTLEFNFFLADSTVIGWQEIEMPLIN